MFASEGGIRPVSTRSFFLLLLHVGHVSCVSSGLTDDELIGVFANVSDAEVEEVGTAEERNASGAAEEVGTVKEVGAPAQEEEVDMSFTIWIEIAQVKN